MSDEVKPLDLPLSGVRLIEASAGTGKTFTLAGLYLRLLVERRLAVREILVMTFTRAATQELRERIRGWLARAAVLARDPELADPDRAEDAIIRDLLGRADETAEMLARRLTEAATRMDEATITTIHGYSQMAAAEYAFDSGIAFDRGEQTEDAPLIAEAVTDEWRQQVIGGDNPGLTALWSSPEACLKDLRTLIDKPHQRLAGPDTDTARRTIQEAQAAWAEQRDALQARLAAIAETSGFHGGRRLGKRVQTADDAAELMAELDQAVAAGPAEHALIDCLGSNNLGSQLKGQAAKDFTPGADIAAADAVAAAIPLVRLVALRETAARVRARLARIKAERRLFSYDDMIAALHDAVTDPVGGAALADALHRRWPVALVDECQDTDARQYGILKRLYRGRAGGALIMIGDPKQAIYAFRGGDVFAYFQAARDADDTYSLDTNFRSTAGLIKALDTLFTWDDRPFVLDEMAFREVKADGQRGRGGLTVNGEPVAPLTLWTLPAGEGLVSGGDAKPALQVQCVAEIQRLLDPKSKVRLHQGDKDEPLHPRDICVLVTSNDEARNVQRALARQNIPAACAHRASVFASDQAGDLLRLLRAAATPTDPARLRTALVGELFGCRLGDFRALADDERHWHQWYDHFQQAHRRWADHGVLAMLEPLIQAAAPRLLALEDGERRMTNWLHLAEQLQAAEPDAFGMAGLTRWLTEHIAEAGTSEEAAAELRLESEEDLVQIVTVHRAKGLEYPVVMVPFAYRIGTGGGSDARPDNPPFEFHDAEHRAWLDPRPNPGNDTVARAVRERKAEGTRLLYVALTRARQAVYLGWGPIKEAQNSALAWLLHGEDGCPSDAWQTKAEQFGQWFTPDRVIARADALAERGAGAIRIKPVAKDAGALERLEPEPPPTGDARRDLPARRPFWGVLSFSALVRGEHAAGATRTGADDETRLANEVLPEAEPPGPPAAAELEDLAGPAFGTAVHDILEQADFAAWPAPGETLDPVQAELVRGCLLRHGIPPDFGGADRVPATAALIGRTLHTPLPGLGPLAALPRTSMLPEMPFTLRLGGESTGAILALLREHGYASALPDSQRGRALRGLMEGFIDLVAEADGRFWVLDYKTNRLAGAADYAPERLGKAIRDGHYDLQYLIYLTALHRHLRQRLPGYDPARHLGGVQYLFIRGMSEGEDGRGVFQDRPDPALIQALDARFDAVPAEARHD